MENKIKLSITSPVGATLITSGKYCDSDIEVIPYLQDKTVTESGEVLPDEGYAGLRSVTVEVESTEPKLQEKTVTENGEVTADEGYDGLSKVTVKVAPGYTYKTTATAEIYEPSTVQAVSVFDGSFLIPTYTTTATAEIVAE